jgi:cytochrome c oxidase subunit 1
MASRGLNALSFWLLPIAGIMMLSASGRPRRRVRRRWTGYAPLSVVGTNGNVWFNMGVQWAARRRS